MKFLLRADEISDTRRNEFILLSDLMAASSLVDAIANKAAPETTQRSVLGPFHRENSPFLAIGGDLIRHNEGDRVVIQGHVRSVNGEPIAGALLNM